MEESERAIQEIKKQLSYDPAYTGLTPLEEIRRTQNQVIEYEEAFQCLGVITANPRKTAIEFQKTLATLENELEAAHELLDLIRQTGSISEAHHLATAGYQRITNFIEGKR